MTIKDDVFTRLSNDATVAAAVSSRIYCPHPPQSFTRPALSFSFSGGSRTNSLTAMGTLVNRRCQIDAWADTNAAAEALIKKARDAMTGSNTSFRAVTASEPIDMYDDNAKVHRIMQDFSVWYTE